MNGINNNTTTMDKDHCSRIVEAELTLRLILLCWLQGMMHATVSINGVDDRGCSVSIIMVGNFDASCKWF